MITIKNINKIIDILKLVRNSTALMELVNSPDLQDIFENNFGKRISIDTGCNLSEFKLMALSRIFMNSEIMKDENLQKELAADFIFIKLYDILKEYSETKFDEENINNDNN